jgi:hypothetical protein
VLILSKAKVILEYLCSSVAKSLSVVISQFTPPLVVFTNGTLWFVSPLVGEERQQGRIKKAGVTSPGPTPTKINFTFQPN